MWTPVAFAHTPHKGRLVAAVVDENRVFHASESFKELMPDSSLIAWAVGPKAMLDCRLARANTDADEVVKIAVRDSLDIKENQCAVELQINLTDQYTLFSRIASALSE